jgi:xanthine dehydrogenase accessory factor
MECSYASDILTEAARWFEQGRPVASATIVHITGSSSRPLGTSMICTDNDEFVGAVSGGCVETDVCRVAADVIRDGKPRVVHYGRVRDPLLDVGLNCDGDIDVLVEAVDEQWLNNAGKPFIGLVNLTVSLPDSTAPGGTSRGTPSGTTVPVTVTRRWTPASPETMHTIPSAPASSHRGDTIILEEPVLPPPLLLIFGAGPVADDLSRLAGVMGYTTVISDPRESRFGGTPAADTSAHRTFVGWPADTFRSVVSEGFHLIPSRTYIVSLEHEPRFEDALWQALLEMINTTTQEHSPTPPLLVRRPAYIGAIGKSQRALERDQRARHRGIDLSPLRPIHTPVGLDIGGKASAEIALSILAQIVATIHGKTGGPIRRSRDIVPVQSPSPSPGDHPPPVQVH